MRKNLIQLGYFLKKAELSALVTTTINLFALIMPALSATGKNSFLDRFQTTNDLLVYIFSILLLLVAVLLLLQFSGNLLIQQARHMPINVRIEEYLQPVKDGEQYISLKIFNQEDEDLIGCSASLVGLSQSLNLGASVNDIDELINPNHLPLSWGAGDGGKNITIPSDKEPRVLNIGIASFIPVIDFLFDGWKHNVHAEGSTFRYVIQIKGNLSGEKFRTIRHIGCFRPRQDGSQKNYIDFYDCAEQRGLMDSFIKSISGH